MTKAMVLLLISMSVVACAPRQNHTELAIQRIIQDASRQPIDMPISYARALYEAGRA